MTVTRCVLALAILSTFATASQARVRQQSDRDRAEAACYKDAKRFCRDAIPDEGKIERCLRANMSEISKECRSFF